MFKPNKYKARYVQVVLNSRTWRRVPMKLFRWGTRMASTKQYNLVTNDDYDTRIPLHPEEAFHYGIPFTAKYIGSMEVPRPSSRVEIVAAMRRVRYEFKARDVKKRKVTVEVSIDGVRVTPCKKKNQGNKPLSEKEKKKQEEKLAKKKEKEMKQRKKKMLKDPQFEEETPDFNGVIMHHPIYRIFYVSHDSSDLKIFSYIARDGSNGFKCNVFKSNKKSQAMRIVRTVGQAFEVCHKMQLNNSPEPEASASGYSAIEEPSERASDVLTFKDAVSDCDASESGAGSSKAQMEVKATINHEPSRPQTFELLPPPPRKEKRRSPQRLTPPAATATFELPEIVTKVEPASVGAEEATSLLSAQHQVQLLRERLEQQAQQTRAAVAQLLLVRDQLAAEQSARCEAQARTHQLLVHNKELLEHISALVGHLQESERGVTKPISATQLTLLPQLSSSAKIDRWFSLLPGTLPALSRPESGFISGFEETMGSATLSEAKKLIQQLGAKKKRRLLPIRFTRRKVLINKHTLL